MCTTWDNPRQSSNTVLIAPDQALLWCSDENRCSPGGMVIHKIYIILLVKYNTSCQKKTKNSCYCTMRLIHSSYVKHLYNMGYSWAVTQHSIKPTWPGFTSVFRWKPLLNLFWNVSKPCFTKLTLYSSQGKFQLELDDRPPKWILSQSDDWYLSKHLWMKILWCHNFQPLSQQQRCDCL